MRNQNLVKLKTTTITTISKSHQISTAALTRQRAITKNITIGFQWKLAVSCFAYSNSTLRENCKMKKYSPNAWQTGRMWIRLQNLFKASTLTKAHFSKVCKNCSATMVWSTNSSLRQESKILSTASCRSKGEPFIDCRRNLGITMSERNQCLKMCSNLSSICMKELTSSTSKSSWTDTTSTNTCLLLTATRMSLKYLHHSEHTAFPSFWWMSTPEHCCLWTSLIG